MEWEVVDLASLERELRSSCAPADAEKMVFAFERALALARCDAELLPCLLAATASLLAWAEGVSPRSVLETYFRRAVSDETWHERYSPLFG